jgi:thymidylate synthase
VLGVTVSFPAACSKDPIIERFGDTQMKNEMAKVFFSNCANELGHSYAHLMRGPNGRNDLQDVILLLQEQPTSKRALVMLCGENDFKVPCVNAVQFLVREGAMQVMYFSRGQDAFKKFYADGLCLGRMTQTVADGLGLPLGWITGFIGSSHIYHQDRPAIEHMLKVGKGYLDRSEEASSAGTPAPTIGEGVA